MFDRFTDDAKRTMNLARQSAEKLRHSYLGTEHILLGLLELDDPSTRAVFTEAGVDREALRRETEQLATAGAANVESLPFTPRAKKVLELAMVAAGRLGDRHLGTEHLLLGLIQEGEGVAAQSLKKAGLTSERAAAAVIKTRGSSAVPGAPALAQTGGLDEAEAEAVLRIAKRVLERRGEWSAARAVEDVISRFRLDG